MLNEICMPALIYLIFSFTHVIIDTYKGLYNTAMIKFWIGIVVTLLLNILCKNGLGIVSWIIIFVPFLLMALIATIILFALNLDPATGKPLKPNPSSYAMPFYAQFNGSLKN
jgi:ATP/ADP translocase